MLTSPQHAQQAVKSSAHRVHFQVIGMQRTILLLYVLELQ